MYSCTIFVYSRVHARISIFTLTKDKKFNPFPSLSLSLSFGRTQVIFRFYFIFSSHVMPCHASIRTAGEGAERKNFWGGWRRSRWSKIRRGERNHRRRRNWGIFFFSLRSRQILSTYLVKLLLQRWLLTWEFSNSKVFHARRRCLRSCTQFYSRAASTIRRYSFEICVENPFVYDTSSTSG